MGDAPEDQAGDEAELTGAGPPRRPRQSSPGRPAGTHPAYANPAAATPSTSPSGTAAGTAQETAITPST